MDLHIFTVGTSILSNFAKTDEGKKFESSHTWSRLSPTSEVQGEFEAWARKGERVFDAVLAFVEDDPKRASAELNAFYSFEELIGSRPVEIELLSTDTGTGIFCAKILYEHLSKRGYSVRRPVRVKDFGLGHTAFENALANLMDQIGRSVKRAKGKVYLNVTGGFKPESAFAAVAGLLYGVNGIYYIHESFGDIVVLPSPPLNISERYMDKLRELGPKGKQKHLLVEVLGWTELDIQDLVERRLVEIINGVVRPRRWVRPLLS